MTFDEFLYIAMEPTRGKRKGQHFANQLALYKHDLFQGLQAAGLDPYYRDEYVWLAIEWLKEKW